MGRSKRLNNKKAKEVLGQRGSDLNLSRFKRASFNVSGGDTPQGRLVRDTRRPASTGNNWFHGVLFLVIAAAVISWALGY